MITEWMRRGYNNNMEIYDVNNMVKPHWLGKEEFHSSHRANLLRKDYEYYSQFGWKENPQDPYVWHDVEGMWYEQHVGTGERVYFVSKSKLIAKKVKKTLDSYGQKAVY